MSAASDGTTAIVERVQELSVAGHTDQEIAASLGWCRSTVVRFRARHGIRAARPVGKTRRGEPGATAWPMPTLDDAPRPAATEGKRVLSVAEFLLNKRRALCPVCQLKDAVKAQVLEAKQKGERQADIIEYLQVCHRITITPREFASHVSGRHDA